jgi:hypothetical protein
VSCEIRQYLKGARPVIEATFRAPADPGELGDLIDPTSITVITRDPAGAQETYTEVSPAVVRQGLGVWVFSFPDPCLVVGEWWVYVNGDGAASESSFKIGGAHVVVPP